YPSPRRAPRRALEEWSELRVDARRAIGRVRIAEHRTPQLDEVVACGYGDDERSSPLQHPRHLVATAPSIDRQREIEGRIDEGQPAVGVGDDPSQGRMALRGALDRVRREVHAGAFELEPRAQRREEVPLSA